MGPRRLTSGDAIAPNVGRGARNGTTAFGQSDLSTSAADNRPARIFIVEDDPVMLHMVADYLEQHNIHAVPASGRQEMIRYFTASEPDLVILDLRLGQEDGFDLLREIRTRSDVPIIITTGDRRDEIDRVVGLELGADDYVTKPFSLRELLARVRAVLRRPGPRGRFEEFAFGDVRVRPRVRQVWKAGWEGRLTRKEFDLLVFLIAHRGEVITRERLLDEVWGY